VRDLLEHAVDKFNTKVTEDEKLRAELDGLERTIVIQVKGGAAFHLVLKDQRVDGVQDGPVESPDITVTADERTLTNLLKGDIGPMRALATNKLKLQGSIEDLLRIRKFF
jgi:putative sterol carrier protein